MKLLSRWFSILLGISMAFLLMGLFDKSQSLLSTGLAILISIPVFRAIYSAVWFAKLKHYQGMWFSIIVVAALMTSMLMGVKA